jgi:hypothetical protein
MRPFKPFWGWTKKTSNSRWGHSSRFGDEPETHPVQDEAIQAVLGMNQKHTQFKMRPFKWFWGWTKNTPSQDEAIQTVLGMNQKHTQFKMRPFKLFWGWTKNTPSSRWGHSSCFGDEPKTHLVQDEAIQAVLGVNQKHILFLCPTPFSAPKFSPPNYFPPFLPTSPLTSLTSFPTPSPELSWVLSPHFPLSPSPELRRAPKLKLRGNMKHMAW